MENSKASKPYPFDGQSVDIRMTLRQADPENPKIKELIGFHRLRRPTIGEVKDWEKTQSAQEQVQVSTRETEIVDADDFASVNLWNHLIMEVKGYNPNPGEFRPLSDEDKKKIPVGHKLAAIRGLYQADCSIIEDEEAEGFSFDKTEYQIRQRIGSLEDPYIVVHTFRDPTEQQMRDFRKSYSTTHKFTGGRKGHFKILSKIETYITLYDALIISVETGGKNYAPNMVDPVFKRQAVSTFIDSQEALLQD